MGEPGGRGVIGWRAILAFGLGMSLAAATVASAQDPPVDPENPPYDVGVACQSATNQEVACDTEYTPVAKDPAAGTWEHVGGAIFGENGDRAADSPTPYTVDLYTVRFDSSSIGFAGGAACADPDTAFEALKSCERVPVIYRFLDPDGPGGEEQGQWAEVYRGTSEGYVGAIAFDASGQAIAVGGTGSYPRRELKRGIDEDDAHYVARDLAGTEPNAAGRGLAWTYDGEEWDEVEDLPLTPQGDPMHGLNAIGCSTRIPDGGRCLAGGLRQLWVWAGGAFTGRAFTDESPRDDLDPPASFLYRVRAIAFMPGSETPPTQAVALTAGCCTDNAALNHANTIGFDGERAYLRPGMAVPPRPMQGPSSASGPIEAYDDAIEAYNDAVEDTIDASNATRPRDSLADSFYSVLAFPPPPGGGYYLSALMAPGGPSPEPAADGTPAAPEQASRIYAGQPNSFQTPAQNVAAGYGPGIASEAVSPSLSTARLVAGDGDAVGAQSVNQFAQRNSAGDSIIDWAVGELTSTGQGIAFTTTRWLTAAKDAADCPGDVDLTFMGDALDPNRVEGAKAAAECQPNKGNQTVDGTRSRRLIRLPTYALNGFSFIPGSNTAWAVGDRGALLRLGGKAADVAGEPTPPHLGSARPAPLPDTSPYDGRLPEATGPVGSVPPLELQPERRIDEPRLVPAGAPDPVRAKALGREDVNEIVMSRDGTEGWAVGSELRTSSNNPGTTLFHFIGGRWTRCDTDEVPGVIEPDRECKALAPLRNAQQGGRPAPTPLIAAARVPLERDDDPSNDDEFEVVAVGDPVSLDGVAQPRTPVLHYRDGRWTIDQTMTETLPDVSSQMQSAELTFVAPDDGWLLVEEAFPRLYRFDGERWHDCIAEEEVCGSPIGLFPPTYGSAAREADLAEVNGRIYVAMTRIAGGNSISQATYPMVAFKDPGGTWSVEPAEGGLDPGCEPRSGSTCTPSGDLATQGRITEVSVGPAPGGGVTGWLAGRFGGTLAGAGVGTPLDSVVPMMRLERTGAGGWTRWDGDETLSARVPLLSGRVGLLTMPDAAGDSDAWLLPTSPSDTPIFPLLAFRDDRWQLAGSPFSTIVREGHAAEIQSSAVTEAAAPDGRGGFWLAARQPGTPLGHNGPQVGFFHYTDRVRDPVFKDAPHPVREPIAAAAGGADGSLWVATESNVVYRYTRYTGWDRVAIPGWDAGRIVTRPSEATAIAVGPDGEGLVVGRAGRIAELSPRGVRLDSAAGAALCGSGPAGPCGTGQTLRAVAIGPDGSAIAGGDGRTVMWRPAGGSFRTVSPPPTADDARITGVSLPQAGSAYLVTDNGQVWAGDPAGGSWRLENGTKTGRPMSADGSGNARALNAISLDGNEHGFAVGDAGVILERTGDGGKPWRRVDAAIRDSLYSVAQPATGEGGGVLIGGGNGAIYTLSGSRFEVARPGDPWHPLTASTAVDQEPARIIGLAMLPGSVPGEVEAWAATRVWSDRGRSPQPQALLRYRSGEGGGADDPEVEPLPDVPAEREGEVTLAALGRTECGSDGKACPEAQDSNLFSDTVVRRTREELAAHADETDGSVVTVFTGDAAVAAGSGNREDTSRDPNVTQQSWVQFVAGGFRHDALPLFGAVGLRDLTRVQTCTAPNCVGTADAGVGTSTPWRQAMSGMPAPWGDSDPLSAEGVTFAPVEVGGDIDHPDGATSTSGAQTHYALDMVRSGEKLLRLVFTDNSLRSLASSEPNQNPIEQGGQEAWLDTVLCRSGEAAGCTRASGEPAVVVANTPTYSYGPGGLDQTATDAATFEQTLLQYGVSALISGRLGWNGLYYTCAPQLHTPQPGDPYPESAPQSRAECAGVGSELPVEPPDPTELLGEVGAQGILPGVIAASAGGRFGPNRNQPGTAADGYWHGYSIVRVPANGDPAGVIVEQRPVFDWVGIRPAPGTPGTHMVRAGKKLALEGFGREVVATDVPLRYDEITTAAITHRYDLVEADPDRAWLPRKAENNGVRSEVSTRLGEDDPCGPYLCLDPKVGAINDQSGEVRAGKGNYPRTYAVAMLSAGAKSTTYPLVFEPRASYRAPTQPQAPPVAVPPPPPPPAPAQPTTPQVNLPAAPVIPVLTAQALAPPPLPPSPPTFASEAPLDLNISPTALDVTPPTAVSQPPTPPVNPAPPSGARREARQRQAAAQKSGADSDQEGSEAQDSGGDLAQGPPEPKGSAMTRHDFTAIAAREQPSAWARDALLGGGLGIAALILALGLSTARPTPRRRLPEVPAPAQASERASSTSRRTP